jgi:hypothetical protein
VLVLNIESCVRRCGVQSSSIVKPPEKRLHANVVAIIINALQFVEAAAIVSTLKPRFGGFQMSKIRQGKHSALARQTDETDGGHARKLRGKTKGFRTGPTTPWDFAPAAKPMQTKNPPSRSQV